MISHQMVINFYMFDSFMKDRIRGNVNCSLIVIGRVLVDERETCKSCNK